MEAHLLHAMWFSFNDLFKQKQSKGSAFQFRITQTQDELWKQYGKPIWCRKTSTEEKIKTTIRKISKAKRAVAFVMSYANIELIFFEIIRSGIKFLIIAVIQKLLYFSS